jgi:hypothetical protein
MSDVLHRGLSRATEPQLLFPSLVALVQSINAARQGRHREHAC